MLRSVIRIALLSIVVVSIEGRAWSQEQWPNFRCDSLMFVSGAVTDAAGRMVPAAMVVNRSRDGGGQFVDHQGTFLLAVCPGDTIAFGAIGFHTTDRIAPMDRRQWDLVVKLKRLQVEIGTAEVVAPRELREILNDIEALGYDEEDYRISKVDAFSSPITFLYQMFNRDEQSKRAVAKMENRDERHDLLRELFIKYVDYDIITLKPADFDAFIAFSDPGDELLQQWTQYEFIRYIQQRFELYRSMPSRLNDSDYQYQWD
ncbi:MAG: carboxypeptidase-like regulatory domain-containing protein [Flavobacteriales bacterium]|nr:carboxypeptidase-like regulatory domain-containing protein [Flavobacteriales bacterium]